MLHPIHSASSLEVQSDLEGHREMNWIFIQSLKTYQIGVFKFALTLEIELGVRELLGGGIRSQKTSIIQRVLHCGNLPAT